MNTCIKMSFIYTICVGGMACAKHTITTRAAKAHIYQLTRDYTMIKALYIYIAFLAAAGYKLYMTASALIHPLGG